MHKVMKVKVIKGPQTEKNIEKCQEIIRKIITRDINKNPFFKNHIDD